MSDEQQYIIRIRKHESDPSAVHFTVSDESGDPILRGISRADFVWETICGLMPRSRRTAQRGIVPKSHERVTGVRLKPPNKEVKCNRAK